MIIRIAYNVKVLNMGFIDAVPHKDLFNNANFPKI